jgi:hypothetical protein
MMVTTGFSIRRIKHYLKRWAVWWAETAETWDIEALLSWFIETCWQLPLAAIAEGLRQHSRTTLLRKTTLSAQIDSFGSVA